MIGVIGVNHTRCHLEGREILCKALRFVDTAYSINTESLLLETCNRVEWYFVHETPAHFHASILSYMKKMIPEADIYALYTFFEEECFHHLVRVTSGQDSFFVGETEIQAQVKKAYLHGCQRGSVRKTLHQLFQKSFHKAKEIRSKTFPAQQQSLTKNVSKTIQDFMDHWKERKKTFEIFFVGASMINKTIAASLSRHQVSTFITNRSADSLATFSKQHGSTPILWERLDDAWPHFDCVIAATRSPKTIILDHPKIDFSHQLLIDLGVPRNIDPNLLAKRPFLYNLEHVMDPPKD